MPAPLTRSSAARTSLLAKVALVVVAPVAVAGAIFGLKDIPTPHYDPPDLTPGEHDTGGSTVRPVNYSTMTRVLRLAAEFPPPPEVPTTNSSDPDPGGVTTPSTPGLPIVRFLGAIAEPGRYVALLNIDGRQKFLGPGEMYARVRVVECTASQVRVQFDNPDGSTGGTQSIAVSERQGPGWTTGTAATGDIPEFGDGSGEMPSVAPTLPGMPPGFTLPPGMSPQQVETIRREFEARQRSGDASS